MKLAETKMESDFTFQQEMLLNALRSSSDNRNVNAPKSK